MRLTLLRHGTTTWNDQRLIQGQSDASRLTSAGRDEIRAVLSDLRERDPDLIVASDLTRAWESARIVADALGVELVRDARLRERNFGTYEGRPLDDLGPELSGVDHGRVIDVDARPPLGESLADMRARLAPVLEDLHRRAPVRPLLVTHGGAIRVLRALCEGSDLAATTWYPVTNASLWDVAYRDGCVTR